MLTEDEIKQILKKKGWPEFVSEAGSSTLLKWWKETVEKIEKGYPENTMIEDYYDDVCVREMINQTGLDEMVRDLDERFKKATIRRDVRTGWSRTENKDSDFWYFGYPKNATGNFLRDFEYYMPENLKSRPQLN